MYSKIYTIQNAIASLIHLLETMKMNIEVYGALPSAKTPMTRKSLPWVSGLLNLISEDVEQVKKWDEKARKEGVYDVFREYADYKIVGGRIVNDENGYTMGEHGYDKSEVRLMTDTAMNARSEVNALHRQIKSLKRDLKTVSRLTLVPMHDVTGVELIGFYD